jgi:hypothetical protein
MENNILTAWKDINNIVKDKKVDLKEIPLLLNSLLIMVESLSKYLFIFKINPQVAVIIDISAKVLSEMIDNVDKYIPEIEIVWNKISDILEDDKIDDDEMKKFLLCLSELLNIIISIALPFITKDSLQDVEKFNSKILEFIEAIKK